MDKSCTETFTETKETEFLEDNDFRKLLNIGHSFFTRKGGVSTGYYDSLNCCYKSQDNPAHVRENRRRVMQHLGYPLASLVTTENNHTNKVAIVEQPWAEAVRPEADVMVTKLPHIFWL